MCPNEMKYSKNITVEDIENLWPSIEKQILESEIDKVFLSTYGNILCENEFPKEVLEILLKKINEINKIRVVIFETHYKEITEDKLKYLKNILTSKYIDFEIGVESVNKEIQSNCLNKIIDLEELKNKINLIHKYEMTVEANVLIGIPFLNAKQQIEDAVVSTNWLFNNDIDEVVIFPVNIIKKSSIEELYKSKKYNIISQWMVIQVLNNIKEDYLNRISISMYGEYKTSNMNVFKDNILPKSCSNCYGDIMNFYDEFLKIRDIKQRKELIINLLNKDTKCNCKNEN